MSSLTLKLDGKSHTGWLSARVTRGIERVAGDFVLAVTETVPGGKDVPKILPGMTCEVFSDQDKIISGYIDEVGINYDGNSRQLRFRGRSKTADLVDCSAVNEPSEWSDVTLKRIASDIAGVYGISVIAGDVGAAFKKFRIQQSETAFDVIERACRLRSLLLTDDEDGNLLLIRAGSDRASTEIRSTLDDGVNNVLASSSSVSLRDRFSKYEVLSQSSGTDNFFGEDAAQIFGSAEDKAVSRKRVLRIISETQGDISAARDRARWEAAVRRGQSLRVSYRLRGWRQANGDLWKPNQIVSVKDDLAKISGDLLIAEVSYELGDAGHTVSLTVVPPETYMMLDVSEASDAEDPLAKYLGAE